MPKTPPNDAEAAQFKANDAASYDPVKASFHGFSETITPRFAAQLVRLATLRPGGRVLDVGTGTGVAALEAARTVGDTGFVLGIDLSAQLVDLARSSASRLGVASMTRFAVMDAETLAVGSGAVDVVLALYSVSHFPDPLGALREMRRALRAGGRLVIGVGAGPRPGSAAFLGAVLARCRDALLARRGKLLVAPGALEAFLETRLPRGPEPLEAELATRRLTGHRYLRRLVTEAGFSVTGTAWQGHRHVAVSPAEFWSLQRTLSSRVRKRLNATPEARHQELEREFSACCERVLERKGQLVYPSGAFFVHARRP